MGDHHDPGEPRMTQAEPAAVAEAARVVLAILVGAGWLSIGDQTTEWIISVVGLAASVALTVWTRKLVTPVAEPKDITGNRLVPLTRNQ